MKISHSSRVVIETVQPRKEIYFYQTRNLQKTRNGGNFDKVSRAKRRHTKCNLEYHPLISFCHCATYLGCSCFFGIATQLEDVMLLISEALMHSTKDSHQ